MTPKAPGPQSVHSDNPSAEKAFKEARDLFDKGQLEEARKAFSDFARIYTDDPLAPRAEIYRGRIAILVGKHDLAEALLEPVAKRGTNDVYGSEAIYWAGVGRFEAGDFQSAAKRMEQMVGRIADREKSLEVLRILWLCAVEVQAPLKALGWIDEYLEEKPPEEEIEKARQVQGELITSMSDPQELRLLAKELSPKGASWPMVMARLGTVLQALGEPEGADEVMAEIDSAGRAQEPEAVELAAALEKREQVDLRSVGCLLPLSGRMRLVGEASLRGIMLGTKEILLGEDQQPLSAAIRDTGGSPKQALAQLEKLVREDNVAAVVGPMDGAVSQAVAKRAKELGVPLILLGVREGLSSAADGVFRGFPSSSNEIEALVDASSRLGSKKYAVAYPKSAYGKAIKNRFSKVLRARGMDEPVTLAYEAAKNDFVSEAKALAKEDFDTLLIADKAANVALFAPALAAAGLWSVPAGEEAPKDSRPVRLLLSSVGYSKNLAQRAGRYLQGALAASHFFAEATDGSRHFVDEYTREYGEDPTYYSAYGHDAVVLVASAVDAGAVTRRGISERIAKFGHGALLHAAPFKGFDKRGEPVAAPWIVTLVGDEWEILP